MALMVAGASSVIEQCITWWDGWYSDLDSTGFQVPHLWEWLCFDLCWEAAFTQLPLKVAQRKVLLSAAPFFITDQGDELQLWGSITTEKRRDTEQVPFVSWGSGFIRFMTERQHSYSWVSQRHSRISVLVGMGWRPWCQPPPPYYFLVFLRLRLILLRSFASIKDKSFFVPASLSMSRRRAYPWAL